MTAISQPNVIILDTENMYNFLYLLANDVRHDFTKSRLFKTDATPEVIKVFKALETWLNYNPVYVFNGGQKTDNLLNESSININKSKNKSPNIPQLKGELDYINEQLKMLVTSVKIKDEFFQLILYVIGFMDKDITVYQAFDYVIKEIDESNESINISYLLEITKLLYSLDESNVISKENENILQDTISSDILYETAIIIYYLSIYTEKTYVNIMNILEKIYDNSEEKQFFNKHIYLEKLILYWKNFENYKDTLEGGVKIKIGLLDILKHKDVRREALRLSRARSQLVMLEKEYKSLKLKYALDESKNPRSDRAKINYQKQMKDLSQNIITLDKKITTKKSDIIDIEQKLVDVKKNVKKELEKKELEKKPIKDSIDKSPTQVALTTEEKELHKENANYVNEIIICQQLDEYIQQSKVAKEWINEKKNVHRKCSELTNGSALSNPKSSAPVVVNKVKAELGVDLRNCLVPTDGCSTSNSTRDQNMLDSVVKAINLEWYFNEQPAQESNKKLEDLIFPTGDILEKGYYIPKDAPLEDLLGSWPTPPIFISMEDSRLLLTNYFWNPSTLLTSYIPQFVPPVPSPPPPSPPPSLDERFIINNSAGHGWNQVVGLPTQPITTQIGWYWPDITVCTISNIIDAGGFGSCEEYSKNIPPFGNIEKGNIGIRIQYKEDENIFYQLTTQVDPPLQPDNVNMQLLLQFTKYVEPPAVPPLFTLDTGNIVVNYKNKDKTLGVNKTFQYLVQNITVKIKSENGISKENWIKIKDELGKEFLNVLLRKSIGDMSQEFNAVIRCGAYLKPPIYYTLPPGKPIAQYDENGNAFRCILSNDQPSAARILYYKTFFDKKYINLKSYGGYLNVQAVHDKRPDNVKYYAIRNGSNSTYKFKGFTRGILSSYNFFYPEGELKNNFCNWKAPVPPPPPLPPLPLPALSPVTTKVVDGGSRRKKITRKNNKKHNRKSKKAGKSILEKCHIFDLPNNNIKIIIGRRRYYTKHFDISPIAKKMLMEIASNPNKKNNCIAIAKKLDNDFKNLKREYSKNIE